MPYMLKEITEENSCQKKLEKTIELAWLIEENKDSVDSETIDGLIKLIGNEDTGVRK
jgi:hypothetical protein